ncbi:hypothetical protein F4861DRAFT_551685 [Xylaria intraflava]|nr:hypothetical protein F4861DRAFT_551685 [Xylaria intraflava]
MSVSTEDSDAAEARRSLTCPKCKETFTNIHDLNTHQEFKKHFVCRHCSGCFWSESQLYTHKRDKHPSPQSLDCFGCRSRFTHPGEFWQHLESGKCPVILPSDIAKLRKQKLDFAEQLEKRRVTTGNFLSGFDAPEDLIKTDSLAPVSKETAPDQVVVPDNYMGPVVPLLSTGNAYRMYYRNEDFPDLPTKRNVPTGPTQGVDGWANDKATSQTLNGAPTNPTEGEPQGAPARLVIIDPDAPGFNVNVFFDQDYKKYACPHRTCFKKFPLRMGLIRHLLSPDHTGGRFHCIRCNKVFATVSRLISHMETATRRCCVRDSDEFRTALGQLTGGIVDYNRHSGTFFVDKNSVQELLKLRSNSVATLEKKKTEDADVEEKQGDQGNNYITEW